MDGYGEVILFNVAEQASVFPDWEYKAIVLRRSRRLRRCRIEQTPLFHAPKIAQQKRREKDGSWQRLSQHHQRALLTFSAGMLQEYHFVSHSTGGPWISTQSLLKIVRNVFHNDSISFQFCWSARTASSSGISRVEKTDIRGTCGTISWNTTRRIHGMGKALCFFM